MTKRITVTLTEDQAEWVAKALIWSRYVPDNDFETLSKEDKAHNRFIQRIIDKIFDGLAIAD